MKPTKTKSKVIAIMFFAAGGWGLAVSFMSGGNQLITFLSAINLGLGGLFTFYYTKAKK